MHKAKGNMYEFITHLHNPIQGQCPHYCEYCWSIATRKRFKQKPDLYLNEKTLKENLGKDKFIFVCSSIDMFAYGLDGIEDSWIKRVLEQCRKYPDNKYLFQSKNPRRIKPIRDCFPKNTTFATTIESNRDYDIYSWDFPPMESNERARSILFLKSFTDHNTMITIEPILDFDIKEFLELLLYANPVQINIGADSGRNKLPEPSRKKYRL